MTTQAGNDGTPVADALETLRDVAHEWRVEQSRRHEVTVSFDLPLSAVERDVLDGPIRGEHGTSEDRRV